MNYSNRPQGHKETKPEVNSFARNVIKLSTGDLVAQIISLGAIPLITRMYSPGDYGVFSIYLSFVMVVFPVSTFRFNSALMLPKESNDAANLLALSILSVIFCSLLLALAAVAATMGGFLPRSWDEKGFGRYLWLVPPGVLVQGVVMSISFWALRNKMFGNMASARIIESVIDRGVVLGSGFWAVPGALFLILGRVVGPFAALCFLIRQVLYREIKKIRLVISISEMARLARRYREYHVLSTLAFFVNNLGRTAPVLILAMFYPPLEIGFYALATRVIQMPMMLIGDSVSKVFLQKATFHAGREESLGRDTKKLFSYLVYISLPIVIVLIWFGENLFGLIFGTGWAAAGVYARILAFAFFGMFLYRPLSALFDALERPRARLIFNSIFLIGRVAAVMVGASLGATIIATLFTLALTTCLLYAGVTVYLFALVGVGAGEIISLIMKKAMIMAPIIIAAPFSKFLLADHFFIALFVGATMLMLQGVVILTLDPGLRRQLLILMPFFSISCQPGRGRE